MKSFFIYPTPASREMMFITHLINQQRLVMLNSSWKPSLKIKSWFWQWSIRCLYSQIQERNQFPKYTWINFWRSDYCRLWETCILTIAMYFGWTRRLHIMQESERNGLKPITSILLQCSIIHLIFHKQGRLKHGWRAKSIKQLSRRIRTELNKIKKNETNLVQSLIEGVKSKRGTAVISKQPSIVLTDNRA